MIGLINRGYNDGKRKLLHNDHYAQGPPIDRVLLCKLKSTASLWRRAPTSISDNPDKSGIIELSLSCRWNGSDESAIAEREKQDAVIFDVAG